MVNFPLFEERTLGQKLLSMQWKLSQLRLSFGIQYLSQSSQAICVWRSYLRTYPKQANASLDPRITIKAKQKTFFSCYGYYSILIPSGHHLWSYGGWDHRQTIVKCWKRFWTIIIFLVSDTKVRFWIEPVVHRIMIFFFSAADENRSPLASCCLCK